ncbi:MAG: hypothetical protein R8P61_35955 [Bacteroidia bacterium]|nr:hypothetical protein [Bacteroidia bacterium]
MTEKEIHSLIDLLSAKGVSFDKGLSEVEIAQVKTSFQIEFPEDLKAFLQTKLPVSVGFVHWRYGINSQKGKEEIIYRLNGPAEGIYFDIRHNGFWMKDWGEKPDSYQEQKTIAYEHLLKASWLIPIYSHRYMPGSPSEAGNPVFSVHQTDIIYYGRTLADYFSQEFHFQLPDFFSNPSTVKSIPFWSELVS